MRDCILQTLSEWSEFIEYIFFSSQCVIKYRCRVASYLKGNCSEISPLIFPFWAITMFFQITLQYFICTYSCTFLFSFLNILFLPAVMLLLCMWLAIAIIYARMKLVNMERNISMKFMLLLFAHLRAHPHLKAHPYFFHEHSSYKK